MFHKKSSQGIKRKRRACRFCKESYKIDHKDIRLLGNFVTERGRIVPRRISGNCAKHQRDIMIAVKRARILALLPFTSMHKVQM